MDTGPASGVSVAARPATPAPPDYLLRDPAQPLMPAVLALVEGLPDDHPMHTPGGVRPLSRYLPSRVAELTIHTVDLARALGVEAEPPRECVRTTLYALADYAVRQGTGAEVAFALTGRAPLPPGFSVVP